jgi:DNA-binding response OmpR family regulator
MALSGPRLLVVDLNADSRSLLERTLRRKFPDGTVLQCQEADEAVRYVKDGAVDLIIAHRTFDLEGAPLVRLLRNTNPALPIIMISGIGREEAALEAGATCFLQYDAWLRLPSVAEQLIKDGKPAHR